jgi:hypothetical protein
MHVQVARERVAEQIERGARERRNREARRRAHKAEVNRVKASLMLALRTDPDIGREG